MKLYKSTLSSMLAAVFMSASFAGVSFADDPDDTVGDLNGNKPLSIRQMNIANAKALRAARTYRVPDTNRESAATRAAYADFPDQTVGDLNGNNPVPVRRQAADNTAAGQKNLLILPFIGDWNGTSKKGFPHQ